MLIRFAFSLVVLLILLFPLCFHTAVAATFSVSDAAGLQNALTTAAANNEADTITVTADITLTATLVYPHNPADPEAGALTIEGPGEGTPLYIKGDTAATFPLLEIDRGAKWDDSSADITLRNLTFYGGGGDYFGGVSIDVWFADVTIENCRFHSNRGRDSGSAGGLYVYTASDPGADPGGNIYLTNCTFAGNSVDYLYWSGAAGATLEGSYGEIRVSGCEFINNLVLYASDDTGAGGLYADAYGPVTVENCTFDQNQVQGEGDYEYIGGGASLFSNAHLAVTDCTFTDNSAYGTGGLYADGGNTLVVTRSDFLRNTGREGYGGGAYLEGGFNDESPFVLECLANTFSGNSSVGYGGGAALVGSRILCVNNIITGNTCSGYGGGGLYMASPDSAVITNNTVSANTTAGPGGGLYFSFYGVSGASSLSNNIVWGNSDDQSGDGDDIHLYNTCPVAVSHNIYSSSAYQDAGLVSETGNLKDDPKLAADGHLRVGSPAIDAGDDAAPELPAADRDGSPRISGAHVDMGAYEGPYVGLAMPWMNLLLQ
jgi:parallel beta-helix repeat protein